VVNEHEEAWQANNAPSRANITIRRSYLICAAARTGSNLLAAALRRSCVGGMPFEYFNALAVHDDVPLKELGISAGVADLSRLAERLDKILYAGTTRNGIFGATVHWWDVERLLAVVSKNQVRTIPQQGHALDGLRSFFPGLRYIWLRRENKVAQAISHYIATKSGAWLRLDRDPLSAEVAKVEYDFAAINEYIVSAEVEEAGWRQFLAGSERNTLALTYEELAADYRGTVIRTLAFLGVTLRPEEVPPPEMLKQADSRSREWEERYREEERTSLARSVG
jgi:LPS sulfotransferase NodH